MWIGLFVVTWIVCNGHTVMQPNTGTMVKSTGQHLNAAVIKLNLLVKIPVIHDLTLTHYPFPCNYLPQFRKVFKKGFDIHHHGLEIEYNRTCSSYEQIRKQYLRMRSVIINENSESTRVLAQWQKKRLRRRRSLGHFFRSVLGIAHLKKQKLNEKLLNNLGGIVFENEGKLKGLDYCIQINDKRINVLTNLTETYVNLVNNITGRVNLMQTAINNDQVIRKLYLTWIGEALVAGSIQNQLLAAHTRMVQKRVKAFGDVLQGRLTPEVISPIQLNETLKGLQVELQSKYQGLKLSNFAIWDYYHLKDITSVFQNDSLFVSVPVKLEMVDQTYELFEINSFMIPTLGNSYQVTKIMEYSEVFAFNDKRNSYFSITYHFLNEHCKGRTILRCNKMNIGHDLTNAPSCASVIFQNKLEEIKELCTIGLMEISPNTNPTLYDMNNGSVLIINPARKMIYSRCDDYDRKKEVTDGAIVTVHINCFCYLFNDEISTPVYAGTHCLDQTTLDITTSTHTNLLYLAELLNKTLLELEPIVDSIDMTDLPHIEIPEYMVGIELLKESKQTIYDFRELTKLQKNNFKNSINNRVIENTKNINNIYTLKIIAYVTIAVIIIILLGYILLTCRVKNLGQLLAINQMLPVSHALPISSELVQETANYWSISVEVLSLIVLFLALCYWVYNHLSMIKRTIKYCAFPLKEFDIKTKQPALTILLYFTSLKEFCYLNLDEIYALPHEIELLQSEIDIEIVIHETCCSSYITINHKRLGIRLKNSDSNILIFNKTIAVPAYNKFAMRKILESGEYNLQVLVGENRIYRHFEVKLKA